ncbi:ATPase domain-containing protein [Salinigranum halophilum]|jgi:circadian clock protein KaiC|uniref:ATPase domain-containing protein n=1 Tax=Salinigranum halophilum TaxID=2565931 RepID=UPI00191C22B4|nr:ATPase domain-containing protein [Salinigranum halophilum]
MAEPPSRSGNDVGSGDEGSHPEAERLSSGISGLDTVLGGGFLTGYHYLIRGTPGAGKTVLGWHFLTAGGGGDALYVTFEERPEKIRRNAASLGLDLDGVTILDLSPEARSLAEGGSYDVFAPSAVEYEALTARVRTQFEADPPSRVLLDPVTQLRYLAPDEYQFRRELLSLMDLLTGRGETVLFTSQTSPETPDDDLQFMSDGVLELRRPNGGRVLDVPKFRGAEVTAGPHAVRVDQGGMSVYPRVVPERDGRPFTRRLTSSGVPALDDLLHGGIELGTTTLFSGPTGIGKTTVSALFLIEAARRGHHSVLYHLEEKPETFIERCAAIDTPVTELLDDGTLEVVSVTPSLLTVGEFLGQVQSDVTADTTFVMIDGVQGFEKLTNLSEEREELSALRSYLTARGVTVVLTDEMPNITGDFRPTKSGETAIADNIVFMRYLEFNGEIHRAIGVLKKRTSDFEHRLRRFEITEEGIRVGDPLTGLSGVLTGDPQWVGTDPEREGAL